MNSKAADPVDRRKLTAEAALALVDDLSHMRNLMQQSTISVGDVRRMSALLRRLLIDRDLIAVASARIGKIKLIAPDLKPIFVLSRKTPPLFFSACGCEIFGFKIASALAQQGQRPTAIPGYSPDATTLLNLDGFLNQDVIQFRDVWIKRREIIKYIASIASGVHSSQVREESHSLIRHVRHVGWATLEGEQPAFGLNLSALDGPDPGIVPDKSRLDFILLELMSAAHYLIASPDVCTLTKDIEANG